VKELFYEIAENHEIEIDTLEVAEDHVPLFVSFPPRLSISNVEGEDEKHIGECNLSKAPGSEAGVVGWELLASWVLCAHIGRSSNNRDN